ncbi:MAG: hypothetical protein IJY15_08005, partial [Thermoguttaceae bacterium]|nr:hypothetical protein [Thermoguttaceae bacterium]
LSLTACVAEEKVNVFALKGPTGIGMIQVMENHPETYNFNLAGAGDEKSLRDGGGKVARRARRGAFRRGARLRRSFGSAKGVRQRRETVEVVV